MYLESFLNIKQFGTKYLIHFTLTSLSTWLYFTSGQLGAVRAHWGSVQPGEGGQLGGGEGVLVHLDVLHTISPPRALAGNIKEINFCEQIYLLKNPL